MFFFMSVTYLLHKTSWMILDGDAYLVGGYSKHRCRLQQVNRLRMRKNSVTEDSGVIPLDREFKKPSACFFRGKLYVIEEAPLVVFDGLDKWTDIHCPGLFFWAKSKYSVPRLKKKNSVQSFPTKLGYFRKTGNSRNLQTSRLLFLKNSFLTFGNS